MKVKTGNDRLKELWEATAGKGASVGIYRAALEAEILQLWPQLQAAQQRVAELLGVLHHDQTGLAQGLAAVVREVRARDWICEGRGNYEWDDDRYIKETGWALEAIKKIAEEALRESGKLVHPYCCPAPQQPAGGSGE